MYLTLSLQFTWCDFTARQLSLNWHWSCCLYSITEMLVSLQNDTPLWLSILTTIKKIMFSDFLYAEKARFFNTPVWSVLYDINRECLWYALCLIKSSYDKYDSQKDWNNDFGNFRHHLHNPEESRKPVITFRRKKVCQ